MLFSYGQDSYLPDLCFGKACRRFVILEVQNAVFQGTDANGLIKGDGDHSVFHGINACVKLGFLLDCPIDCRIIPKGLSQRCSQKSIDGFPYIVRLFVFDDQLQYSVFLQDIFIDFVKY